MKKSISIFLLFLGMTTMILAQEYNVCLKIGKGLKLPMRHTQVVDQEVSMQGRVMKMKQIAKTELAFSVVDKKGDNYIIEGIINKSDVDMESPQGKMKISSADSVETPQNKELKALVGKVFRAEITPSFQLVGEVSPVTEGLTVKKAKQLFDSFYSLFNGLYSAKPLKQGEEWNNVFASGEVKGVSVLTSANENSYIIDSKVSMEQNMQGILLTGKGTMNHEIHAPTGVPIFGLLTLPLTGSVVNPAGGSVDVRMTITSSFEFIQ